MGARVTIEPIGETVDVEEGQTILDACLRAGVWLPHACLHGLCGTCKVSVVEGHVDHGMSSPFALMDFERDEGKTLACCATIDEDVTIEADIEEDPDAQYVPVRDYVGEVARLEDLTPDIKGVWLNVEGAGVTFQAGQYINLQIPSIEGARAFSIASAPSQKNLVELHIRKVRGGVGTTYIHEKLALGDKLSFSGPYGRFFVRKSIEQPVIFIAGGSGLSSPKSMVLDLLESGDTREIYLFHGVRARCDLYFEDLFRKLEEAHPNFHYVPALSEPKADDVWKGATGFVHEAAVAAFDGKFVGNSAYLCGPPPMIEAAIRALMKGRLFEKDIFTERFVTAADGEAAATASVVFKRI